MGNKKQSSLTTSTQPATTVTSRVDIPPVTGAEVAAFSAAVNGLVSTVNGVTLQVPAQVVIGKTVKGRIVKTRKGCQPIIESIGTAMGGFPTLIPPDLNDPVQLGNTLSFVKDLTVLQGAISALAKVVDDTLLAQSGDAWGKALAVYTILQRQAPGNPQLEAALAPMTAFLARTKPAKPKDPSSASGGATAGAGTAATGPASAAGSTGTSTGSAGSSAGPVPSGTTSTGVPIYTPPK